MMDERSESMSRRQVLRITTVAGISLAFGGSLTAGVLHEAPSELTQLVRRAQEDSSLTGGVFVLWALGLFPSPR